MGSWTDSERFAREFHQAFGEDPAHLRSFLQYSERIHRVTGTLFLERSLHEWNTIFTREFWRSVVQLHKIDAFRTMDRANGAFFGSAHIRQFFNRYATYNGSDPYQTPATLNIIPHVEYGIGASSVAGGIYAVPRALERLARDVGVKIHYGVAVEEILTAGPAGSPRASRGGAVPVRAPSPCQGRSGERERTPGGHRGFQRRRDTDI